MMHNREHFRLILDGVTSHKLKFSHAENYDVFFDQSEAANQKSTNDAFSEKWVGYNNSEDKSKWFDMQKVWYLDLYGFTSESEFAAFLSDKSVIYDAGCGLGYKAAWFAELAPHALVVGMDFSEAAAEAAKNYKHIPNLFFVKGDISEPFFKSKSVDYVCCDQVIMHTEAPEKTFSELSSITKEDGQFACYFYAKKALPRELIDDYFRTHCTNMSYQDLMEMSDQLTELGKRLSELNITFDAPSIPALGIKGGEIDIQRFIYWNFLKCFWNEDLGRETSTITNFDWYSPSNARRFSEEEIHGLLQENNMEVFSFHTEEACYSGRFVRKIAA